MKTPALIAVAASCGLLAAAGAGVTSWAVITAGENAASQAASQVAGDDGVFVGDELNALLFTDEQVATFGIGATVDSVSSDYGTVAVEAAPPCSTFLGQTPRSPAGVRSIEIGAQGARLFTQIVVQFPTVEDAEDEMSSLLDGAAGCATFADDFGNTSTWLTAVSLEEPQLVGGLSGWEDGYIDAVVIGRAANAVSYTYADVSATNLAPDELAQAIANATAAQLAG